MSGLFEIEAGGVAAGRAGGADVRHFAEMVVRDHTAVNAEIRNVVIAHALPVRLPTALNPEFDARVVALKLVRRAEFDRLYTDEQVAVHLSAVKPPELRRVRR